VLGHGNHRFQLVPKQIRRIMGERIVQTASGAKHSLSVNVGSSTLFAFDFKIALNSGRFADLWFRVDGKVFPVHRAIVFARCPYLRAYTLLADRFRPEDSSSLKDHQFGEVVPLPRMRQQVFTAVLHYIYTDHLKAASHWLSEIKRVATLLRLPRLVALCTAQQMAHHPRQVQPSKSTFAEELSQMVESEDWSDVVFIVSDHEAEEKPSTVHAHKALLACRSDYFKHIFNSSFAEGEQPKSKPVEIQGTRPKVFVSMLEYLYTGLLPAEETEGADLEEGLPKINPDTLVELLLAADRFLVDDLKQLCEAVLEQSLEASNVCWMLELSDRSSPLQFKQVQVKKF